MSTRNGRIVAELELIDPKLNFVNAKAPEQRQTQPGPRWTETMKRLVSFDINRGAIHGGQVHYRDFDDEPRVDIFVQRSLGSKLVAGADKEHK